MINCRLPNIRNYVTGVSPLNVFQHDGKNFKAKGESIVTAKLEVFSYLNIDIVHYKVLDAGHNATSTIDVTILLEFLEGSRPYKI